MARLTNSIDYCATHCDFGKRGVCFFKNKSKCYEKSMFDRLKAYEEVCSEPEKLKLIDELYFERCEEVNRLNDELEEVKYENEETKKYNLELMEELNELDIFYRQICKKCDSLKLELKRMKEVQDVN